MFNLLIRKSYFFIIYTLTEGNGILFTHKHTDTHNHTQANTQAYRHAQSYTSKHTSTQTHNHTQANTQAYRHTQSYTSTHKHPHTQIQTCPNFQASIYIHTPTLNIHCQNGIEAERSSDHLLNEKCLHMQAHTHTHK